MLGRRDGEQGDDDAGGLHTTFEVGTITAYDWRSGVHSVLRDGKGCGTLHVRLRAVADLSYEPPAAPSLAAGM